MKNLSSFKTLILILLVLVASCKKKVEGPSDELKKATVENYASIVYANYSDALAKAEILKLKINDFVSNPTQAGFEELKQAWLDARLPYGQSEAFRFYAGPIDDDNGPEGLLNSWPLDEAYIDYVQGNPNSGIINNVSSYPIINKNVIESLNEIGGETNISCGYHAIEFLLWGQDSSVFGPGNRPYTDFTTANNAQRRREYLKACGELLVEHLTYLVNAWSPSSSNNYRELFVNNVEASLKKIIEGIGFLTKGELAGERIEVAYDSQLQEDEHSCFSDNTHNDIRMNILGIQNVFLGTYLTSSGYLISGSGVYDIIKAKDAAFADVLKGIIEDSKAKCFAINSPFDQQIISSNSSGRAIVKSAIDALKLQGDKIAEAAKKIGYNIKVE